MTRLILTATAVSLGLLATGPAAAEGLSRAEILDRVEDRIDRRESIRDERVDLGPRDVIEDRLDRRESVLDRAGFDRPRPIDRWERRSWRRLWGGH